jgi:hypothetical protein
MLGALVIPGSANVADPTVRSLGISQPEGLPLFAFLGFLIVIISAVSSLSSTPEPQAVDPLKRSVRRNSIYCLAGLPFILVIIIYIWFISAGEWTSWPQTATYNYESKLATAFQNGHLYLEDTPSQQLLALPDPYRLSTRKNIPFIWDASLYKGKYYLYWGPTPAIVLLAIRLIFGSGEIGDNYLVFGFICGLFLAMCLLIVRIWDRYFAYLPKWMLLISIFMVGLAPPLTWMLNRPEIYEAAIASGQFFLLGGLYLSFLALDRDKISSWLLCLASMFWGLAIGSRTSLVFSVLFLIFSTSLWVGLNRNSLKLSGRFVQIMMALLLPISLVGAGLGWYNWVRFGSILEFGYRYQLTLLELPKRYGEIFSSTYIVPNLFNYFLNPFLLTDKFPFIIPQYGQHYFGPRINFPRIYFSESVTGLVYTLPMMVFAMIPLLMLLKNKISNGGMEQKLLNWLQYCLIGITIIGFVILLAFFFATMRYLADVVPAVTLLCVLGFWQGFEYLARHQLIRRIYSGLLICLVAVSIILNNLLAISSYQERFWATNPSLMEQLNRLFGH